jgi:phage tail sheath protein FI
MQRMPSAFDRVNVRRLFILLEKQTKAIARYYVFEPNSLYTRTRVVDDLTPIFEAAKANTVNQGIYDYLLICDDRNNPPAVIDANELVVDIYIKPVRTAEFILVNFHATRTSANFQEILR